jgi:superfamily II DNA/RNA helicase
LEDEKVYVFRIGCTGRAGRAGVAVLRNTEDDREGQLCVARLVWVDVQIPLCK